MRLASSSPSVDLVRPVRSPAVRARLVSFAASLALASAVTGCERSRPPEPAPQVSAPPAPTSAAHVTPSADAQHASRSPVAMAPAPAFAAARPVAERVVAIGDLHGDLEATRNVLRLAGLIDDKEHWAGGKTVVVQTGDEVDRGDGDRQILDLFERLKGEADKAGGAVVPLLGNHELMNAAFDFRYVTPGGFAAFGDVHANDAAVKGALEHIDPAKRGRSAAFGPGGAYATLLSGRAVVAQIGDTLFVHGGVLPKHVVFGLDKINTVAREWLSGKTGEVPGVLMAEDAPVWTRMYSTSTGPDECAVLDKALALAHAKRMVMGHTVQRNGITSACDGKAWRIDVGMSKFFGGRPEALELRGDKVTVLK